MCVSVSVLDALLVEMSREIGYQPELQVLFLVVTIVLTLPLTVGHPCRNCDVVRISVALTNM